MKHYQDYKKLYSALLSAVLFFTPLVFIYAQTAGELSNKISQKNAEIAKLEEEIKGYQTELTSLEKQKSSLNGSLKQLDITAKKLAADIAITQSKIERTNLKISSLNTEINTKEVSISNTADAIALDIRRTNEYEREDVALSLLSQNDLSQIWNEIDTMAFIREEMTEKVLELKQVKVGLEDTRAETEAAKNELVSLKSKLGDQKKIVDQNTAEKKKLLTQTKNSEASYQNILKAQLSKIEAFEKELREYESQLKFILDPSKLPSAGVLGWPLDEIFVTQQFGAKTGPHRTYASGHSGTDFRARTPVPV